MPIRLFNTLTKAKDVFTPLDPKNVRMYVCGPTVYDFAHIGNARPAIVFDVLFRLLRHEYGAAHVTYVRNITDVDDKINARAAERGVTIRELTEETAKIYFADVGALGCLEPTITPRATEHIAQMIALNEKLIAAGHAYVAEGHVLYDVSSKPDYGKLANRSLKEMVAGARVEVAPYKKGAMDFVLWKPSDIATPGWDSPWGRGRPGWHIECSAMAGEYLGESFDIHGGGIDLMFPHHENEIAQSEGAHHGHALAQVWMHNGFLQVEGEKMSKSAGNFFTIRELLSEKGFGGRSWPGEVLRHLMLKTHYRQPIDWTLKSLEESYIELATWVNALSNSNFVVELEGQRGIGKLPRPSEEVIAALADDLNTSEVYRVLRELFGKYAKGDGAAGIVLAESLEFLGLMRLSHMHIYNTIYVGNGPSLLPREFRPALSEVQTAIANNNMQGVLRLTSELASKGVVIQNDQYGRVQYTVAAGLNRVDVDRLIEARKLALAAKDFAEGDRIRNELSERGIILKDYKDEAGQRQTSWEEVKR